MLAHLRRVWPQRPWIPAALAAAMLGGLGLLHGIRAIEAVGTLVILGVAYASPRGRRIFVGLLPFILTGYLYSYTRFVRDLNLGPVHVLEPYLFDRRFFSLVDGGVRVTPNEFFRVHHWTFADVIGGVAYGVFIYVPVAYGVLLTFRDPPAGRRFCWSFFVLNVLGFATYHLYPAAPPWYAAQHGFGPVDPAAHASPAALVRFDALLGVPYFRGMYAQASEVFGAIPSLHVAYPLAIVLEGWRRHRWPGRALAVTFYLVMVSSAVYLDHHYVLDVLIGSLYAVVAVNAVVLALRRRAGAGAFATPQAA